MKKNRNQMSDVRQKIKQTLSFRYAERSRSISRNLVFILIFILVGCVTAQTSEDDLKPVLKYEMDAELLGIRDTTGAHDDSIAALWTAINAIEIEGIQRSDSGTVFPTPFRIDTLTAGVYHDINTNKVATALNTEKVTNATHTGDVTGDAALTIGVDRVDEEHINWGTSTSQVSAIDMPIADAGSIITGEDVETALQENRTAINAIDLTAKLDNSAFPDSFAVHADTLEYFHETIHESITINQTADDVGATWYGFDDASIYFLDLSIGGGGYASINANRDIFLKRNGVTIAGLSSNGYYIKDNYYLGMGSSLDFIMKYNSTSGNFEFGDGTNNFLTVTDQGSYADFNFNGNNITDGSTTINQTVDDVGQTIYGFDDRSSDYLKLLINASGYAALISSSIIYIQPTNTLTMRFTSSGTRMYNDKFLSFGVGDLFQQKYNSTSGNFEFGDGTNNFLTVTDQGTTADFKFYGGIELSGNQSITMHNQTGGTLPMFIVNGISASGTKIMSTGSHGQGIIFDLDYENGSIYESFTIRRNVNVTPDTLFNIDRYKFVKFYGGGSFAGNVDVTGQLDASDDITVGDSLILTNTGVIQWGNDVNLYRGSGLLRTDDTFWANRLYTTNAGSAGAPAYSVTSGTTTGMYFPTSTSLGFSTGGVPAVIIDASQVVTFTQFPITPSAAPTTDYQVINLKYFNDNVGSGNTFVTATAHGLTIGDGCVLGSGGWVATNCTTIVATAGRNGVVYDANTIQTGGDYITSGLTPYAIYYYSNSDGDWATTPPSTTGQFKRQAAQAMSTTILHIIEDYGYGEIQ